MPFIRNINQGPRVLELAKSIPRVSLAASLQPITSSILRICLTVRADFERRSYNEAEPFWIWVEDENCEWIFHSERLMLTKRLSKTTLEFAVPVFDPIPAQYYVRAVPERWHGGETVLALSLSQLTFPEAAMPNTKLLSLDPLPISALQNDEYERLYAPKFSFFNPIQTQVFHSAYHTSSSLLIGAPTGSGKTVIAELALFRLFNESPGAKAVYVAPLKALVTERTRGWRQKFKNSKRVLELTGDTTPSRQQLDAASILITTPEKWDSVSRS